MPTMTKDDFFAACSKPNVITANIAGLGDIFLRVPTLRNFERFENDQRKRSKAGNGLIDFRARVAVMVVCDSAGAAMFTDADIPSLSDMQNGAALIAIHDFIAPFLGWAEHAAEDAAKNLQTTTGDASTTD